MKIQTNKYHQEDERLRIKDFFDCILPGILKFMSDYFICGNSYKSVWAVKGYPPSTDAQALLSQLSDKAGVTLRSFHRLVEPMEQRKIIQDAARKNTIKRTPLWSSFLQKTGQKRTDSSKALTKSKTIQYNQKRTDSSKRRFLTKWQVVQAKH